MSRELMDAYSKAIYDAWVLEAVLTCAIKMPWPHDLELLVGYNPQRLLTYQPSTCAVADLWSKDELDRMMGISYDDMVKTMYPETVITPTGRIVYAAIGPSRHGKTATAQTINDMAAVLPRWGESDVDPLADIQKMLDDINDRIAVQPSAHGKTTVDGGWVKVILEGDYSRLEMHALLAMLEHESRPVILDLSPRGGSLPGLNELVAGMLKREKCAAPAARPDYHRHDPSKSHKRRPRRGK